MIKVTPSRDLNNLNFWNWNALRIQPVQREIWQKGGRLGGEWAFADAFKLERRLSRDKFHREITNWETTSCATDGGNTTSPAGSECAAALAAAGIRTRRGSERAARQLHAAVDDTARCTTPRTSTWVSTTAGRCLTTGCSIRRSTSTTSKRSSLCGLVGGIERRRLQPARARRRDRCASYLEANGQLEILGNLRYNVGARYIKTDQFVSGYITVRTRPPARAVTHRQIRRRHRLRQGAAELQHRERTRSWLVLRAAASRTMTRPQPGDIAPNQTLSINGDVLTLGNPALAPYFCRQLRPGSRVVLR